MPKGKKATPKKRAYNKKTIGALPGTPLKRGRKPADTFHIETEPPPLVRGATAEKLALLNKVDRTMRSTMPGQAFIIPALSENPIKRHLKRNYVSERFSFVKIVDNPDALRVYRLHPLPKGGKK